MDCPALEFDKILIVDDDVQMLRSVKRMLVRQGYVVATHDGGPGCSQELLRFNPDLVLLDVRMPFLSGETYVSLFDKQAVELRPLLVLYSGIDDVTLERTAKSCGADGYISKSESGLEFARKVAGFLRARRTARQQLETKS